MNRIGKNNEAYEEFEDEDEEEEEDENEEDKKFLNNKYEEQEISE